MTNKDIKIESLITDLKSKDRWVYNMFVMVFVIFILALTATSIVFAIEEQYDIYNTSTFLVYLLGIAAMGYFGFQIASEYKDVDYGIPTVLMLEGAVRRYQLLHPKSGALLASILFLNLSQVIGCLKFRNDPDFIQRIINSQIPLFVGGIIGFAIGITIWATKQKPLKDRAQKLLNELMSY